MSRLTSGDLTGEVEALYQRELAMMGAGKRHELVQATPIEGGGWCLVYDYTSDYELDGKVMCQRRCAVYGPGDKQAFSAILSTSWGTPA